MSHIAPSPICNKLLTDAEPDDNLQTDVDASLVRSSKDLRGRSNPEKLTPARSRPSGSHHKDTSRGQQLDDSDPDRDLEAGPSNEDEGGETDSESLQHELSGGPEALSSSSRKPPNESMSDF